MSKDKLRIVVVDDEPIIRMDLTSMLKNAGYEVVGEGKDGFDAIELCQKLNPDVALLDIKMDTLDGLSAAKVINDECLNVAIIMLTAYSKGEYIDRAKECQITSYLMKPINEKLLVPNIELAVAQKREMIKYQAEATKANELLESRKIIEKAKGLLMQHRGQSEEAAYNYIRNISKNRNISMMKVSEIIIKQLEG
ncbi:response regulator receiver and ANTAR domain protein [Peptostreptococcaceae bacterium pGA-8]|nr:response regulator receiver and ANTAR domain protein [Peptostreptococcaceae bacterium pGA-8]